MILKRYRLVEEHWSRKFIVVFRRAPNNFIVSSSKDCRICKYASQCADKKILIPMRNKFSMINMTTACVYNYLCKTEYCYLIR